eukprot:9913198-Karenia_brevis.AAC.1
MDRAGPPVGLHTQRRECGVRKRGGLAQNNTTPPTVTEPGSAGGIDLGSISDCAVAFAPLPGRAQANLCA